ncbi:FAD-binding oxidoreductase [Pseudonocardia kujensis]|uniref:NAD(P)/FAD-dependent oxidoreductase n=1 Tax=Pseudonocardia kujensis TaxID=1128675 RepID=UPI001E40989E|nr:FAD-dependent oxidoreductase [Pseudonocardia kujensis]MCE0768077.1 FAD-binding oxidoreductase [Pseudonocardia kujensis]
MGIFARTDRFSRLPCSGRSPVHRSFWLDEALDLRAEITPLRGAERTDVAIVGGGYVGLWTALTIKEQDPHVDVTIVEADVCGGGASGRNGGVVMTWWPKVSSLVALCGADEAMRLIRASESAINRIELFCSEHAPKAEFRRGGWLWTATTGAQLGAWDDVVTRAQTLGPGTFRSLSPEEVARRAGSPQHLGGVLEPSNATVQPAELARALRTRALELGVRIFEGSQVMAIRRGTPVTLETADGTLRADSVVIATNAWAASLRPLRNKLFVISSDMIVTEPIPDRLADIGWTGGEAVTDSQTLVCYYRTTADGRVAFGKGGWSIGMGGWMPKAMDRDASRAAMVARDFQRYYPQLRTTKIATDWAGPIDRTYNSLPIFGRLHDADDTIHYGVGWSGNGVGPSVVGGRILASLALRRQDEWSRSGLVTARARSFPPEPIRFVGAHVVREAIVRKERSEALELRPHKLHVAVSRLAPSGLEDKE